MTLRLNVFHSFSPHEVHAEMGRLDSLFRATQGKAPEVQLFLSTQWEGLRALYSLAVHFDEDQRKEADFFIEQAGVPRKDSDRG